MKTELLREYARLAVVTGVNLQKGQKLVIRAGVDAAPFVRLVTDEAYAVGARDVIVHWSDEKITRARYLYADDDLFDSAFPWQAMMFDLLSGEGAAFLSVSSSDPAAFEGVDPDRIRRFSVAYGKANEKFYARLMASRIAWSIVAIPNEAWAKKIFPGKPTDEAVELLWNAIFDTVRIREGGDAVAAWTAHSDRLMRQARKLNDCNFRYLRYENALGTRLTVELPEGYLFAGGSEKDERGIDFIANMPTEEIFTAPKRDGVNGVVYSSKPLVLNGNLVEGIRLTLSDGRITDVHADRGEEYLKAEIDVDEGAHYLGEVALVPYHSPISESGILFYDTLFDENASCHFAFGEAYPTCIKGGADLSKDELLSRGINAESNTHVDFMVGTSDLSIVGVTRDGREVPVFVNGDFAI